MRMCWGQSPVGEKAEAFRLDLAQHFLVGQIRTAVCLVGHAKVGVAHLECEHGTLQKVALLGHLGIATAVLVEGLPNYDNIDFPPLFAIRAV